MKYIVSHPDGGYDHTHYWPYLDSVRSAMPKHIFEFASDPENHDLTSPNSLHDSWLESWNILETGGPKSRKDRTIQIEARFLGSRWDRNICLTYKNVGRYEVFNSEDFEQSPSHRSGHGDLLVHEMRIVRDGLFAHEMVFSRGSVFLVEFADFDHRIELRAAP